jgi:hypothetical protein
MSTMTRKSKPSANRTKSICMDIKPSKFRLDEFLGETKPTTKVRGDSQKIMRWLCYLMKTNLNRNLVACIPNTKIMHGFRGETQGRSAIAVAGKYYEKFFGSKKNPEVVLRSYFGSTFPIAVPRNLYHAVESCIAGGKQLVLFSLMILGYGKSGVGHQNALVIDVVNKTIERFEPNGSVDKGGSSSHVDKIMRNIFVKQYFPSFTYIAPLDYCPHFGPQQIQHREKVGGYCVTYSTMYLHMRMIDPEISREKIVSLLSEGGPKQILDRVKKYQQKIDEAVPEIQHLLEFDDYYNCWM